VYQVPRIQLLSSLPLTGFASCQALTFCITAAMASALSGFPSDRFGICAAMLTADAIAVAATTARHGHRNAMLNRMKLDVG
jgi:hypothetical protein